MKQSLKQERSCKACFSIAKTLPEDSIGTAAMVQTRRLSVVVLAILLSGGYPYRGAFFPPFFDTESRQKESLS
jgi:hypothetical protein